MLLECAGILQVFHEGDCWNVRDCAGGFRYFARMLPEAYLPERTIAIADLGKETVSVDDLRIEGV